MTIQPTRGLKGQPLAPFVVHGPALDANMTWIKGKIYRMNKSKNPRKGGIDSIFFPQFRK